jgi:hypothetical protein
MASLDEVSFLKLQLGYQEAHIWPAPLTVSFQGEINEILPKQSGAITNTEDLRNFENTCLGLAPLQTLPKQPPPPRSDPQKLN